MRDGRTIQCICTIPPGTGQLSNWTADVRRLNASAWLIRCVPKGPRLSCRAKKTVCFMHVCLHFGFYTKSRDSSVFRQHWYALQARDFRREILELLETYLSRKPQQER
jgi:hypothetical protein